MSHLDITAWVRSTYGAVTSKIKAFFVFLFGHQRRTRVAARLNRARATVGDGFGRASAYLIERRARVARWAKRQYVRLRKTVRRPLIIRITPPGERTGDAIVDLYGGSARRRKRILLSIALSGDDRRRTPVRPTTNSVLTVSVADESVFVGDYTTVQMWAIENAVRRHMGPDDRLRFFVR